MLKVSFHPNWHAYVDGVETTTFQLVPSYVGVSVGPGVHQVRMEYRPQPLRTGLLWFGLLTLALLGLAERRRDLVWAWCDANVWSRVLTPRVHIALTQRPGTSATPGPPAPATFMPLLDRPTLPLRPSAGTFPAPCSAPARLGPGPLSFRDVSHPGS